MSRNLHAVGRTTFETSCARVSRFHLVDFHAGASNPEAIESFRSGESGVLRAGTP